MWSIFTICNLVYFTEDTKRSITVSGSCQRGSCSTVRVSWLLQWCWYRKRLRHGKSITVRRKRHPAALWTDGNIVRRVRWRTSMAWVSESLNLWMCRQHTKPVTRNRRRSSLNSLRSEDNFMLNRAQCCQRHTIAPMPETRSLSRNIRCGVLEQET